MAETFKLTNKFTPNLEKRAVFTLSDKFQPSEELLRQQAETAKQRALQSGLNNAVSAVSADLKSGTNSVGKRKMSAGLNYYVNGNPIPSKNPAPGVAAVNKAAEDYAKKATAGDGYESLSLDELKSKTEKAKKDYEKGFKGENIIQTGLNILGGNNAYKHEYEKLREAYNNRINAFNEYNRNIALQKGEKTYDEKEYDIKSKGALGKTVDVLEHVDNIVSAGGNMFRQGANATMNATLGNLAKAFGFKNNMFQQGYDYATYANNKANEKMELSAKQLGDKNNISGTIGANIVNMIPDIILAYASGGASTLEAAAKANLGLGAKSASLLTATQRGITELAKNPMFFTSFAGEVGNDYYEAMANGATESQAMLAALTASTVNAALEVGGVQELPSKLLENKSLGKKTLDWVLSSLSEGKEEVLQDFISQLSAKAIYDKDKEVFSLSDQGAIINPERMAKEFGLGAAAGGLMGGGMLTFNSIVNSKTKAEYKQIGATARKLGDVDGLINYAQRSIDNDIRTLAYNTDSESISDLELGQLYAYACRDIDGAINSPKELNIAIDNFNEIASSTDSKLINGIASSRIIERLTSAGIDSESAKYMAESATQTDTVNSVNETDNSVNGEFGTKSVFTEYSAKKYKADPIESYMFKEHGREKLSDDQLQIVMVARKLGHGVVFEDTAKTRGFKSDGYIEDDGTIHIDYENTKPVQFIFKHELTHYAEGSELYKNFVETVKASKTYKKWIAQKVNGKDSAAVKSAKYRQSVIDGYAASGIELTPMQAESELIADFVGDTLFTEDGTGLESIMSDMNAKQRKSFVQYIKDFFAYIKDKLSRNKTATSDILKLEKMFNETLSAVEQKNTADEGGVRYSFAGERAVTADKSLLETAKQRIENGEDSETVRRETGWFKGYDGKWRFEINDKMSELVENPKLETHGNDEDGLYQTARLADVLKHDDLFKAYPELKDYKVIIQETNTGVEGSFFPKRKEIVLSRNLFERITKEYYDYLNGGRKAEIAKIEQTPEYKEYSKFYDNPELANIDPEEWLKLEKEARDKFFSSELGKRYYQLNWGKVDIRKYEPGWSKGAKAVLFHEIQHAIQNIEGFASGSNITNWQSKINSAESEYRRAEKEYEKRYDGLVDVLARYGFSDEKFENIDLTTESGVKEAKKYLEEVGAPNGALELADALIEYANDRNNSFGKYLKLKNRSASDLYESTAGEIESRDVEKRLNYSAEQRKNTLPDIDRTDVVFADGSVSSFLSKGNKSDSKRLIQLIQENINEIPKNNLYDISGDGIIDGVKSRYILDIFDMQGNTAYRKDLGTIELTESGAESTIFHGFGKNKLIAAKGIKNVIENGKIISKIENYQNKGNTRYVIAGYGTINNLDSIMAVAINEYVAENGRKSFYLHEIVIKNKDASPFMAEQQKTVSAGKASFDTTVPQKVQSVNTSISENAKNSTEKFSIPFNQAELLDKYDRGEITREEYLNKSNENWKEAVNNYGTIETGENPVNDIPVPKSVDGKQKTERFSRTVIESGKLTNRMVEDMGADILLGKFAYTPVSDESAQAAADKAVKGGFAESSWQEAVSASKLITKDKIAIGEKLLMQAIANKDTKRALELSSELADVLTRNGQNIQAASMFKKMTGAGKLLTVQQYVNTLNKDLEAKYGENAPTVKINELIAQQIAESKPGEDIYSIYEDALQDVAAQVPATFLDKWNAWRYMAMLVNPTTHLRNIAGNGLFIPSVRMKDFISASLETAFIKDKNKRTKSIVIKKEYKEFAKNDLTSAEVKNALKSGGKFNIETKISEKQRIFKNNVLEFIRVGNGNLLEAEDLIFKNIHYKHALAGFLQARGANLNNIDESLLWEARAYAVQEAMKATFNDANSISTALSAAANKNKALNIAINGILPFKKTPINVVRRGVEYSPIGLLKTVVKGSYDLKQGKITASEYIDGLGAGISGTVVFALGTLLSSLGWVTGGFGDDDEDKFKQLNGEQEYALQLFGKSYTIDWAAPACIPFFIGVETVNALREDDDDFKLSDITDAMWNSLEPVINLSMLSGVQSMIESVKYAAEDKSVISLAGNIAKSYFSQGLPTVLGKTARTLDSKRRSNYIDKNSQLSEFSQSAINTAKSKIPGLEATRPEYINAWGQAESNGNIAERIFGNFVSPGYYSDIEYSEMSKELLRLSKKVKSEDVNVFPKTAQKSFEVNGKTKYLTAEEYTKYAKAKGRYSYDYVSEFVNSSEYKKLTDEERAKVISNLYKYANAKAKTEVSDYDITKSFKTVSQWDKRGKSPVIYYIGRVLAEK